MSTGSVFVLITAPKRCGCPLALDLPDDVKQVTMCALWERIGCLSPD